MEIIEQIGRGHTLKASCHCGSEDFTAAPATSRAGDAADYNGRIGRLWAICANGHRVCFPTSNLDAGVRRLLASSNPNA